MTKLELNVMENLNEIDDFNEKKVGDHLIKGLELRQIYFKTV